MLGVLRFQERTKLRREVEHARLLVLGLAGLEAHVPALRSTCRTAREDLAVNAPAGD